MLRTGHEISTLMQSVKVEKSEVAKHVSVIASLRQQLAEANTHVLSEKARRQTNQARVLEMLHAQIAFYMKGHFMKLDARSISVESMLINGFAAKNLIEFYRMLDPRPLTEHDVLASLAATYVGSVFLDDSGKSITFA